ncbi:MAG: type II toxin-antitoxin system RelE/ParE family toxin [Patescibacteria group bacterium]
MTYTVVYHPAVVREDIPALGAMTKKQIRLAIEKKLTTYPDVFGKPLRQSLKGYRKLRVGDWRVIFRIENKIVKIFIIGHRSMVYKEDDRRW